ncbi:MAG: NrdH-redoxin [Chloroflexi bacterium RBG_16_51_9]|nr:MAG: NrdH-redoxin [Chloroflexi bacterium RBG_16_51_9]
MAEKIKVYGTTWCGDTKRSCACLKRLGNDYVWYDIEKDKDACAFVEKVNKGNRSVPTIVFPDGSILVEPSDAALEAKCRD